MKKPIKKTTEPRKLKFPNDYVVKQASEMLKTSNDLLESLDSHYGVMSISDKFDDAIERLENRLKSQIERIERIMK